MREDLAGGGDRADDEAGVRPVERVLSNVAGLRQSLEAAKQRRAVSGRETILFIDEIHRFNKAQQDVLLPYVEEGAVT
jgi:putative ATPase